MAAKCTRSCRHCYCSVSNVLPDSYKQDLVERTARHNVAVIEDDLYGDLAFDGRRPSTAKIL